MKQILCHLLVLCLFVPLSFLLISSCSGGEDGGTIDGDEDGNILDGDDDSSEGVEEDQGDGDIESAEMDSDGDFDDSESTTEQDNEADPDRDLIARVIGENETAIGGPDALARAGDILMKNKNVRFVVQDEGPSRSWVPYGGSIIDADIIRDGIGYDMIDEISPVTAFLKGFKPDKVEIIDDGQTGEKVHVRVSGILSGIPIVDFALPLNCVPAEVVLDYVLYPETNYVEIKTTVTHEAKANVDLGDGIVWSNRVKILTPGFGWGTVGLTAFGEFDLQMAISKTPAQDGKDIVYGFMSKDSTLSIATDLADIMPYMGFDEDNVPAGESRSYTRYFIVGSTTSEVYKAYSEIRNKDVGSLNLNITVADEKDEDEIFDLEILDQDKEVTSFAHVKKGTSNIDLPTGEYFLRIGGSGRLWQDEVQSVTISKNQTTNDSIEVSPTARVSFDIGGDHFDKTVRDHIPARISVQAGTDAAINSGILKRVYTANGEGEFLIEPGDYTITVSRGYEYEICQHNATITAGEIFDLDCTLTRSVDTTGWVAGDFHIHTERSIDAVVPVEERIIQLAAVGLERMPITDHDVISDLDPYVDELGLRDYITLIAGDEVSPVAAHSNGFPMVQNPERNTYFGVQWYGDYNLNNCSLINNPPYTAIWQQMRDLFDAGLIQINHPRSGSQGFLNTFKYDPLTGIDSFDEGDFDLNWDAIELINSGDVDDTLNYTLADWFSFFNQGINKAGTAVSDCHTDSCPGDARTFIRTEEDDPSEISDDLIVQSVKSLRVQASSGPFVTASIGEAKIGDTVNLNGLFDAQLRVKVQAPGWMPLDWVRVVVNGEIVTIIESDQLDNNHVVRFEDDINLGITKDSWVVILAGAPQKRLAPVSPGQPVLTITNPIFIDLYGDGYEAPGLPDASEASAAFEALSDLAD